MSDQQDQALTDAQLLEVFHEPKADLSLLRPDEQQRLVTLTAPKPPAPAPKWYEPGGDVILDNVRPLASLPGKAWRFASEHPVETGAMAGGIAAVPLTGGASIPAAAAAAGLGGAGLGLIAKAARGDADTPQTAGDMLTQMGTQGAIQRPRRPAAGYWPKAPRWRDAASTEPRCGPQPVSRRSTATWWARGSMRRRRSARRV